MPTTLNCPRCGKLTTWEDNDSRPFCSERCKMIDLGPGPMRNIVCLPRMHHKPTTAKNKVSSLSKLLSESSNLVEIK